MAILVGKDVVPCHDLYEWGEWMQTHNRHIGSTQIGPFHVSTVFLGLDHGYGSTHLWFETMVFLDRGHPVRDDIFTQRYSTFDQAMIGHQEAVQKVKSGEIGE